MDGPPQHIYQQHSKGGLSFRTLTACLAPYLKHPFMGHLVKVSDARQPYFTVWTCLCFHHSLKGKIFKV